MEEGDCESPPGDLEETICETMKNVNLEEIKNELFKIAKNTEPNQRNNLIKVELELRALSDEDVKSLVLAKDEKENTALHCAAKAGNLETCKILKAQGADLNATGENGMKVLPFAARYGDGKRAEDVWKCMEWIVNELRKSESDLKNHRKSMKGKHSKTIEEGSNMVPKTADRKGEILFDAQDRDKYNFNILHHAIQNTNWAKNPMVVQRLIETGKFPITDTDHQGNTCLHLAAQFDKQGDDKIFDTIVESKQEVVVSEITKCIKKKNDRGMTPIHIACAVGNEETLKDLIKVSRENKIDVAKIINSHDKNGLYPLCHAITNKNLKMVKMLLSEGSNVVQDTMLRAAR